jgi:hypothetical protein
MIKDRRNHVKRIDPENHFMYPILWGEFTHSELATKFTEWVADAQLQAGGKTNQRDLLEIKFLRKQALDHAKLITSGSSGLTPLVALKTVQMATDTIEKLIGIVVRVRAGPKAIDAVKAFEVALAKEKVKKRAGTKVVLDYDALATTAVLSVPSRTRGKTPPRGGRGNNNRSDRSDGNRGGGRGRGSHRAQEPEQH